ncbi:MAG: helix-turn-helix domain-containing protein [Clostridia bacterium]|nr:helix-turn-helix domain-containing protein [Clostridia bacterium]
MKKFAERLKELRIEKELSQAQLAKATGLSHTAIVYWETEQRVPNANAIIILAEFFGVTTDYLLGVEE